MCTVMILDMGKVYVGAAAEELACLIPMGFLPDT